MVASQRFRRELPVVLFPGEGQVELSRSQGQLPDLLEIPPEERFKRFRHLFSHHFPEGSPGGFGWGGIHRQDPDPVEEAVERLLREEPAVPFVRYKPLEKGNRGFDSFA